MLASSPTGWHEGRDYSKGEGLEALKLIAGVLGMMELHAHTNVISTMEVLLQREHERVKEEKAIKTLTDTTN